MTTELLEQLLHEGESAYLDFKQQQYPFIAASDEQKAELLKDILAFANAWRRTDAFILIGVQEAKGDRAKVLGITTHFDDATVQQFVNSKTQRAIEFAVEAHTIDSKKIDVIRIPVQRRPFYLKKDFGRLKANAVYFRRGTSTAEATPDEISAMGAEAVQDTREPQLEVLFAKRELNEWMGLGAFQDVGTDLALKLKAFDVNDLSEGWPLANHPRFDGTASKSLPKRMEWSSRMGERTSRLYFAVQNTGTVSALHVETHISVPKHTGLFALTEEGTNVFATKSLPEMLKRYKNENCAEGSFESLQNEWRIKFRFERILPGATSFGATSYYFGASRSETWQLLATCFADNLRQPFKSGLHLKITTPKAKSGAIS